MAELTAVMMVKICPETRKMKLQELLEEVSNQEDPLERAKFLNTEVLPAIIELKQVSLCREHYQPKKPATLGTKEKA